MSDRVHADAVQRLTTWTAPDDAQQELRAGFLRHLADHPDGVRRGCRPDHLTASALVLSDDARRVLLTLHAKVGRWLQFGGHVEDDDPSLAAAALREAGEESGLTGLRLHGPGPLQLDRHGAPCSPGARHHLDVQYLALARGCPAPTVSPESHDVRWFDVTALPDDTDDAVRSLVRRAVSAPR